MGGAGVGQGRNTPTAPELHCTRCFFCSLLHCHCTVLFPLHWSCTATELLLLQFIALPLYSTCCTAPELHCPCCSYCSLLHCHSTVLFALHSALPPLLLQFIALPMYCTPPIAVYCTATLLYILHCTVRCPRFYCSLLHCHCTVLLLLHCHYTVFFGTAQCTASGCTK